MLCVVNMHCAPQHLQEDGVGVHVDGHAEEEHERSGDEPRREVFLLGVVAVKCEVSELQTNNDSLSRQQRCWQRTRARLQRRLTWMYPLHEQKRNARSTRSTGVGLPLRIRNGKMNVRLM